MTELSKEVAAKYEIRKNKQQKADFREFVKESAERRGYQVEIETVGKANNIIVGSPSSAKVVYTAHYDTPAALPIPNLITPKCLPIYILYQLLLCVLLYTIPFVMIAFVPDYIMRTSESYILSIAAIFLGYALLIAGSYIIVAGPANKHNANDNTSGVSVLLDLIATMPEEDRDTVAFIFFDLEEAGLLGSKGYKKMHKNEVESLPVINFDCVGDGSTMLFVLNKKAAYLEEKLSEAFESTDNITADIATKGVFYPSDQKSFNVGVGVAAMNTAKNGLLYLGKIHTSRDTVCNKENIDYLVNGSIKLAKTMK